MRGKNVKTKKKGAVKLSAAERTAAGARMELMLAELAVQVRQIAKESRLSRREIAERMGLASPSTIQRIVGPNTFYNVTIETLCEFAMACDYGLKVKFAPLRSENRPIQCPAPQPAWRGASVLDLVAWKRPLTAMHGQGSLSHVNMEDEPVMTEAVAALS